MFQRRCCGELADGSRRSRPEADMVCCCGVCLCVPTTTLAQFKLQRSALPPSRSFESPLLTRTSQSGVTSTQYPEPPLKSAISSNQRPLGLSRHLRPQRCSHPSLSTLQTSNGLPWRLPQHPMPLVPVVAAPSRPPPSPPGPTPEKSAGGAIGTPSSTISVGGTFYNSLLLTTLSSRSWPQLVTPIVE